MLLVCNSLLSMNHPVLLKANLILVRSNFLNLKDLSTRDRDEARDRDGYFLHGGLL